MQQFLKNNLKKIDAIEPEAQADTSDLDQPDYFDLTQDQKDDLFAAAKEFINEFYEQQYLYEQGVLTKNMLSAILKIKSEKRKRRPPRGQAEKLKNSKKRKKTKSKLQRVA